MDNAWEQRKLEARKRLVSCAESTPSAERFVLACLTFTHSGRLTNEEPKRGKDQEKEEKDCQEPREPSLFRGIQPVVDDDREEQSLDDDLGEESELKNEGHLGIDESFQRARGTDIWGKDADNDEGDPKCEPAMLTMEEGFSEKKKDCSEEKPADWLEEWPRGNDRVRSRPEVLGNDWIGKAR